MRPAGRERSAAADPLEVWGGVEYTYNRVQERYFDQMELSGHAGRLEDYVRIAELGIRTLRMGLLWERHELDTSWVWADARMACLRELGVRPIVGLVHHGSGPSHTNLLDPAFPQKLAVYAGQVAERYPRVDAYTPVNEPHTTARFSARYGVWFPHATSHASYLRALLNQVKATVLSMEAIRRVQPNAQLIQTDDVGNVSGTEELRSTWEELNLRQWLAYDLLYGMVDRHHPMWDYLRDAGISEAEIAWFGEHPCPPDVIGINYYLTSDRFLDHRVGLYPEDRRSSEGNFVDVEAVRLARGIVGVESLIRHAWSRYGAPTAITEVHLGCHVDEQIRWMAESWQGAMRARDAGAKCLAITPWALLGSYFWNELVTRENGHYEPGVFDVRSGDVEPTELAAVVSALVRGGVPSHRALSQQGWWRRPDRVLFPLRKSIAA